MSSIRIQMLVWSDMKLNIPDSESPLWLWKSPCTELKVLPLAWKKTFEEWSISTTGNVASEVEVEKDGTLITRSISTTSNVASEAVGEKDGTLIPRFISMAMNNQLNLILYLFLFRLFPDFWTHVVDFLSYIQWCQREQERPQYASTAYPPPASAFSNPP